VLIYKYLVKILMKTLYINTLLNNSTKTKKK